MCVCAGCGGGGGVRCARGRGVLPRGVQQARAAPPAGHVPRTRRYALVPALGEQRRCSASAVYIAVLCAVRKSLHRLYRTVEKHVSEEGGLLQVVWRAMQEEFIAQHVALQVTTLGTQHSAKVLSHSTCASPTP